MEETLKQQSSIEQITVTDSRPDSRPIDSGASKQTFQDGSNIIDSSLDHSQASIDMKKTKPFKISQKAKGKLDDSFQEVTNRRQKKQMDKQKQIMEHQVKMLSAKQGQKAAKSQTDAEEENTFQNLKSAGAVSTDEAGAAYEDESNENSNENSNEKSGDQNGAGLSKKKRQYIEQQIVDKNGVFTYGDDPNQYRKARKRLQNRESAVRSRQKKKQEIEQLEEQVRLLNEQKAAVESANEELKRQNKYWEDLFAKQQLQNQNQAISSDPTRSDLSNKGTEELNLQDLSYDSLDMTRGDLMKRSKKSPSDCGNDFNLLNNEKFEHHSDRQFLNHQDSGLYRNVSFHQNSFEPRQMPAYRGYNEPQEDSIGRNDNYVDELVLERDQSRSGFGKLQFFGLALVFGAVGVMSSFSEAQIADGFNGQVSRSPGQRLQSSVSVAESCSMADEDCQKDVEALEVNAFSNFEQAFFLIIQALSSFKFLNYVSFALALVFVFLWLRPSSQVRDVKVTGSQAMQKKSSGKRVAHQNKSSQRSSGRAAQSGKKSKKE